MHVYMYVCINVCMYVCMYVCIHTYINILRLIIKILKNLSLYYALMFHVSWIKRTVKSVYSPYCFWCLIVFISFPKLFDSSVLFLCLL